MRNVRASHRRDQELARAINRLVDRVDALENEVTRLSEDAGRAFVAVDHEGFDARVGEAKEEPTDRTGD